MLSGGLERHQCYLLLAHPASDDQGCDKDDDDDNADNEEHIEWGAGSGHQLREEQGDDVNVLYVLIGADCAGIRGGGHRL